MRFALPLLFLVAPFATAQSPDDVKATLAFIERLRDPETGAYAVNPPKEGEKPKPSLRACNGAVRAIKYLGGQVTDTEKLVKFVMGCYDDQTGTFAEPGGQPDVAITSIGVMAAVELGIPKERYAKAMEYLGKTAKSFEEVRIAAAAVEAVGVKESGVETLPWSRIGLDEVAKPLAAPKDGGARQAGSAAALILRLEQRPESEPAKLVRAELVLLHRSTLLDGQRADGGWGKPAVEASDAESTYRVMRCLMLMKEKPRDVAKLKEFLASCRRADGGYGVDATAPSSMSGVYYFAAVSKWLNEMEK